jgi:hypothetical protein
MILFTKCPSCIEGNIESLPIAEYENYRFHNDKKRGITKWNSSDESRLRHRP